VWSPERAGHELRRRPLHPRPRRRWPRRPRRRVTENIDSTVVEWTKNHNQAEGTCTYSYDGLEYSTTRRHEPSRVRPSVVVSILKINCAALWVRVVFLTHKPPCLVVLLSPGPQHQPHLLGEDLIPHAMLRRLLHRRLLHRLLNGRQLLLRSNPLLLFTLRFRPVAAGVAQKRRGRRGACGGGGGGGPPSNSRVERRS